MEHDPLPGTEMARVKMEEMTKAEVSSSTDEVISERIA